MYKTYVFVYMPYQVRTVDLKPKDCSFVFSVLTNEYLF